MKGGLIIDKHKLHTIYTAQYRYVGSDRFDITVKGQDGMGKHFAPTWNMVTDLKNGAMTEQEYVRRYLQILDAIPVHVIDWFLSAETRTLVCFCPEEAFCHRNILVHHLKNIFGNRIQYGGFKSTIV